MMGLALPMGATWVAFAAALVAGWCGRVPLALLCLVITAFLGWQSGQIEASAIAILALALVLAAGLPKLSGKARPAGHALLVLGCLALGFSVVPGVARLPIVSEAHTGPASTAFTYSLGLEKPFGVFLLLLGVPGLLISPKSRDMRLASLAVLLLGAVFAIGLWLHFIRWEVSVPSWLPLFVAGNLLFTCLPEEAFFRSYLQRGLARRFGPWPALLIVSLLFGLAHFGGGATYMGLATLAGLAYGLGYQYGGGLRTAVLLHFGFNIVHLLLFTYPMAA